MEYKDYSEFKRQKQEELDYSHDWKARARRILNTVFLVVAAAGLVTYFSLVKPGDADAHYNGLILIAIACGFKIIELLIRFLG